MRELTEKQSAFVREFVRSGNATESAIAAGYSAESAAQRAYEVRHNPAVQEAINIELRRSVAELAPIAIQQAKLMLVDPATPPSVRLGLINSVCDRAGLAAPKADVVAPTVDKPLHQLSLAELEALAARIAQRERH